MANIFYQSVLLEAVMHYKLCTVKVYIYIYIFLLSKKHPPPMVVCLSI